MDAAPPRLRPVKPSALEIPQSRPRGLRRLLPVKIADSYLFGYVLESSLRGMMWFVGLLMAFAFFGAMKKYVDNTVTGWGLLQIFLLSMPRLILFTLPMSLLFGCVQSFADLSARGEATALGVGGMSLPRMMRAPFVFGIIITFVAFGLQEVFVPWAEQKRLDVLQQQILQASGIQRNFSMSSKGDDGTRRTLNAKSIDFNTRTLTKVVVQIYNPNNTLALEIQSPHAVWNPKAGYWIFHDVFWRKLQPTLKIGEGPDPKRAAYISGFSPETHIDYLPDPQQMNNSAKTLQQNLEQQNYEMVSMQELSDYRAKVKAQRAIGSDARKDRDKDVRKITFGIHDKIATPLVCMAMILIGCPLGLRPQRSLGNFAMGLSLMVLLAYYMIWTGVSSIGKQGLGSPLVLAYLPLVLTLITGLALVRKKSV